MRILAGAVNRTWLAIIGVVLLASGALWLLAAAGIMAPLHSRLGPGAAPLSGAEAGLEEQWLPVAVVVLGTLLLVFGLWWLARQIPRRQQAPTLQFHEDAREGVTLMEASAISDAVAREVEELENVTSARAVLRGARAEPSLILRVTVHERAAVQKIVEAVSESVLSRAAQALDAAFVDVGIEVAVTRQSRRSGSVRVQ